MCLMVLRQGDRLVASPPAYTADLSALPAALDGAKRLTEVLQVKRRDILIIVAVGRPLRVHVGALLRSFMVARESWR